MGLAVFHPFRYWRFWLVGGALTISAAAALAQSAADTTDIIRSLAPRAGQVAPSGAPRHERNVTVERVIVDQRVVIVDVGRRIDLEVFFEFNSAKITAPAKTTLDRLGSALASNELAGLGFLIAGHTDAVGSDAYNVTLSQQRAAAVAHYIAENYPIDPSRLVTTGFGFQKLKAPSLPTAAINRRVEVSVIVE